MLSLAIIEQIKKKSGLEFSNAKDFEVLSASFPPGDRLGVNTLKRFQVVRNGEIVRDAAGNELGYVAGRQNGLTELFIKEAAQ